MSTSTYRWLIVGVVCAAIVLGLVVYMLAFRPTAVPDVRMKTVEQAQGVLEQAGLSLGVATPVATRTVGPDLVFEQEPKAGATAPRRSAVDLSFAQTPAPATVPDVVGKEASLAEEALRAKLYAPVLVDLFDVPDPKGSAVQQYPAGGTTWETGRPVAVGVAAGPNDGTGVAVPDLGGMRLDEAEAAVRGVGMVPLTVVRDVNEPQANEVAAQLPAAGSVVARGSTVLVYLELP